jgi:hypothetical protein
MSITPITKWRIMDTDDFEIEETELFSPTMSRP